MVLTLDPTASASQADFPPEPRSVEETGLEPGFLADLVLKTLYYAGRASPPSLSARLGLPISLVQVLLEQLKRDHLCEVTGTDGVALTHYRYSMTGRGLERTAAALERNAYAGFAPVPLADYVQQVQRQTLLDLDVEPNMVRDALKELVLSETTLLHIGRAATSRRSTLMYGASGNGKTTVARSLGAALPGQVLIPYAVEMLGHVVKLYDPSKHRAADVVAESGGTGLLRGTPGPDADRRWAVCTRPVVLAAGEMTRHSLELVYDPRGKVYEAPLQMKANGGMMIIDDFGRQQIAAVELLNRWIVALESRVDHLTLHTGQTVEVPFDVVPLFATNLPPEGLADDAFLRRIRYKLEIPNPTNEEFEAIFRRICEAHSLAFDEEVFAYLVATYFGSAGREMRGCHPRDIVEAIVDAARHDGRSPELTREAVDEACQIYFLS